MQVHAKADSTKDLLAPRGQSRSSWTQGAIPDDPGSPDERAPMSEPRAENPEQRTPTNEVHFGVICKMIASMIRSFSLRVTDFPGLSKLTWLVLGGDPAARSSQALLA